jgi:hypothetical protein
MIGTKNIQPFNLFILVKFKVRFLSGFHKLVLYFINNYYTQVYAEVGTSAKSHKSQASASLKWTMVRASAQFR